MLSPVRFLTVLLLGMSLCFARTATASHAAAGTLTYTSLGGNSYRVRVDYIRDCSGIAAPSSFMLTYTTSCGSTSNSATLNAVGQPVLATPYTSTIQSQALCPTAGASPSTPFNFASYRYEAIITLAPNQWILSVEEGSRPSIANITAGTLRLEATLDNRGRTNNSVQFSSIPTIFFPVNQPNLTHIGAYDVDGDSLSYSLERPLNGCSTYETYATYPTAGCFTSIDPRCNLRLINCTGFSGTYTQQLPIAVARDTVFENGTAVRPACPSNVIVSAMVQPRFSFSPLQGSFSFTPNRYLNTPSAQGDNKYIVVVKVTEWRKENGAYVAIGTTRRDMLWVVYDGGGNTLPRMASTVTVQEGLQTRTQPLSTPIRVLVGEPVSVTFTASNLGAVTPTVYTLEQNTIPGAVIQNSAVAGSGRLTFTPPMSLPNGTYRVSVSVTDDAAPLRNLITVPITFRVYREGLATRHGSAQAIAAYPTPFTAGVQFQLPKPGVQALNVFDQLGRVVAHLSSLPDGKVQWNPGPEVPAGLYSARSADGQFVVRLLRSAAQ